MLSNFLHHVLLHLLNVSCRHSSSSKFVRQIQTTPRSHNATFHSLNWPWMSLFTFKAEALCVNWKLDLGTELIFQQHFSVFIEDHGNMRRLLLYCCTFHVSLFIEKEFSPMLCSSQSSSTCRCCLTCIFFHID